MTSIFDKELPNSMIPIKLRTTTEVSLDDGRIWFKLNNGEFLDGFNIYWFDLRYFTKIIRLTIPKAIFEVIKTEDKNK